MQEQVNKKGRGTDDVSSVARIHKDVTIMNQAKCTREPAKKSRIYSCKVVVQKDRFYGGMIKMFVSQLDVEHIHTISWLVMRLSYNIWKKLLNS